MRQMKMLGTWAITAACLLGAARLDRAADDATQAAPAGAIGGKVVDKDGKALAGATVTVFISPPPSPSTAAGQATTDKDGAFKVTGLSDGNYMVAVSTADKSQAYSNNVVVADGKETALADPIKVAGKAP